MRVLITGSTAGLGAGAARELLDLGHEVVLHARNPTRAASVSDLALRATAIVIGDLASREETRRGQRHRRYRLRHPQCRHLRRP